MYDPNHIAGFFDRYGEREWVRLESDAAQRASLHLHTRFLERFIVPGDRVLEVGAGPGRFTIELVRLGAHVVVTDLAPEQLELNRSRTSELGVERYAIADVTALDEFADGEFDAVVAFGGPLSYALDRRERALDELLRVVRPGGVVLASVMSLAGAFRRFMGAVLSIAREHGTGSLAALACTGDQITPDVEPGGHYMHMYLWSELEAMLRSRGCEILAASSANFVTLQNEELLNPRDPLWPFILELEERFASEPGALSSGTHIIVAARSERRPTH